MYSWQEVTSALLTSDIYLFTRYFFKAINHVKWVHNWHFELIAEKLNAVLNETHPTNHLIFNIPPRHGKTEMAMVNFSALGFAINPNAEIMHLSTSEMLVSRNVTNVRRIMESKEYAELYPNTMIANDSKGYIETTSGGHLYSAPFLGQITGFGAGRLGADTFAGAILIDDPLKTQDAFSETMREKVNFTYANTIISRRNDDRTPVIVTAQRVHEKDFCGYLIDTEGRIEEGGKWDVVSIPAIIDEGLPTERALWEFRKSLKSLKEQRELDKWVFETQYMQNPMPIDGLLFPEGDTKTFTDIPEPDYIHLQCDPADEGKDRTASIVYYIRGNDVYVVDVIYNSDNAEVNIPRIVEQIATWKPATANIESNSAWSLFRKEIKRRCEDLRLPTSIRSVQARANKEVRIMNNAPFVNRFFHYDYTKEGDYKLFLHDKNRYVKMVKDQRDDGVDCDCSACDFLMKNDIIKII